MLKRARNACSNIIQKEYRRIRSNLLLRQGGQATLFVVLWLLLIPQLASLALWERILLIMLLSGIAAFFWAVLWRIGQVRLFSHRNIAIIYDLSNYPSSEALSLLIRYLLSPCPEVRRQAVKALLTLLPQCNHIALTHQDHLVLRHLLQTDHLEELRAVLPLLPALGGWQEIPVLECLAAGKKAGKEPDIQQLAQKSLDALRKKHPSYMPLRWNLLRPFCKSSSMEGEKEKLLRSLSNTRHSQGTSEDKESTNTVQLKSHIER